MRRLHIITVLTAAIVILIFFLVYRIQLQGKDSEKILKVGFIYDGDESTPYTYNFIKAQREMEKKFGERVKVIVKRNVPEENADEGIAELIEADCELIFTTSYGYGQAAKSFAEKYPNIEFCEATCDNANEEPVLSNYHTFMGEVYQGRYISGVVAGLKLKEMIDEGTIAEDEAKIGYVGAFPYAEVISGYTAFILGVRSVVPSAVMTVKYTNTWTSYTLEKECAQSLIDEGCVLISQHSDTIGPAVACEATYAEKKVYHVGYNQSMIDVAPTTSLVSTKINWAPYIISAVDAVLAGKTIEEHTEGNVHGNDIGAGFELDWVQMMELNSLITADGTKEAVDELIKDFKKKKISVFRGDYIGVNPEDESDTYDLNQGYEENKNSSAPSFHYILKDVITIEE